MEAMPAWYDNRLELAPKGTQGGPLKTWLATGNRHGESGTGLIICLIRRYSSRQPYFAWLYRRKTEFDMWAKRFPIWLLLTIVTLSAHAFERPFPPIAKRGTLSTVNYPTIAIDDKVRQLSIGAWIKNESNTIDMPASLGARKFTVNYTENSQGEIDRVWILSPQEALKPAPNPANQGTSQSR
jgi:hypothetical protein